MRAAASDYVSKILIIDDDDRARIVPSGKDKMIGLGLLLFGIVILVGGFCVLWLDAKFPLIVPLLSGGGFSIVGLLFLLTPWRFTFDRIAGRLRAGNVFTQVEHDLSQIQHVQIEDGGLHETTIKARSGPDSTRHTTRSTFRSFECNVVFNDQMLNNKLTLTNHGDLKLTKSTGKTLAEFLGVPFVDLGERSDTKQKHKSKRKRKKRRR